MQGIREIKRRIRSVKNTQQITRAMKMVAAARLRRCQERVVAARPYSAKMKDLFHHVAGQMQGTDDPLFKVHEGGNRICYIVVASDRGQCGAYNSNIMRKAMLHAEKFEQDWLKDHPDGPKPEFNFITVGKKARDYLAFRHYFILREFLAAGDMASLDLTRRITEDVTRRYIHGEVDQVFLVYSEFVSVMNQKPIAAKLLPLAVPKDEEEVEENAETAKGKSKDQTKAAEQEAEIKQWVPDYVMEPSTEVIFGQLVPKYIETIVLQAILEGKAGEFGARMTAMENATKNAEEIISGLTLSYNRARQAGITQELTEIVGGAEVLK